MSTEQIVQKMDHKPKGLPPGWKREVVVRKNGMSAGKTDVYYYSPCGKKFRSKPQIARFLGENADLACFDFSRAGSMGDGTMRRRARDRHPQAIRKPDSKFTLPSMPRPLSTNPLRPSGPIRRTCGVIKLPVTLLSAPHDGALRDSILNSNGEKMSPLNVVVQSLWERRLQGVKPRDHATGKELSRTELMQASAIPVVSSSSPQQHDPTTHLAPRLLAPPTHSTQPVIPSLLSSHQLLTSRNLTATHNFSSPPQQKTMSNSFSSVTALTGTKLLQAHQQQQQSQVRKISPTPPSLPPALYHEPAPKRLETVTETDVRIQEQRVQLLRQQLLAAQGVL